MKYAILADIHANLEALEAVLHDARANECSDYICLGDVVGYHANPVECLDIVRSMGMPCVKGDHDHYASSEATLRGVNPQDQKMIIWTQHALGSEDKKWLAELPYLGRVAGCSLVHASLDSPKSWAYVFDAATAAASFTHQETNLCFCGHTHIPAVFTRHGGVKAGTYTRLKLQAGRKYLINPGSVGLPRDGNPMAAYAIYDAKLGTVELRRIPFGYENAARKAQAAGLAVG